MKKLKFKLALITIPLMFFFLTNANALTFLGKDETGARYFKCGSSCGKFKVIRKAKNRYRIYSINFSGEVQADSFRSAAQIACEETDNSLKKLTDPLPSRGGPSC